MGSGHAPMIALPRGFLSSGESTAYHYCIRPAGEGFAYIPTLAHATIRDDRNIAPSFLMIIIPCSRAIDCGSDLGDAETKYSPAGACSSRADADQNARDPAFHKLQGDLVC